jgi:hypothetical protein
MNHTTQRHPRTMHEAFGVDARSAYPIERYKHALPDLLDALAFAALLTLPALLMVVFLPNGV